MVLPAEIPPLSLLGRFPIPEAGAQPQEIWGRLLPTAPHHPPAQAMSVQAVQAVQSCSGCAAPSPQWLVFQLVTVLSK